jgi:hypothetical protein
VCAGIISLDIIGLVGLMFIDDALETALYTQEVVNMRETPGTDAGVVSKLATGVRVHPLDSSSTLLAVEFGAGPAA